MVLSPNGTASRTRSGSSSDEYTSGPLASALPTALAAKRRIEQAPVVAISASSANQAIGRASRRVMRVGSGAVRGLGSGESLVRKPRGAGAIEARYFRPQGRSSRALHVPKTTRAATVASAAGRKPHGSACRTHTDGTIVDARDGTPLGFASARAHLRHRAVSGRDRGLDARRHAAAVAPVHPARGRLVRRRLPLQ